MSGRTTGHWQLGTGYCYSFPQMYGTYRGAAGFLLLVMLVSSFGPIAMACAIQPEAMHCLRHTVSVHTAQPAMPCHQAMAQPEQTQADASFQATSDCCKDHCCCGATTSDWGQPASSHISFLNLLLELAHPSRITVARSLDIFGQDSARAPPRS